MSGVFEEIVEYGPGGYDTTKPNNNVVSTRQVEIPQLTVNERSIRDKAKQALAINTTFLALATPTNAQNAAQLKALTRQVNALIRLTLNSLDDVSDT